MFIFDEFSFRVTSGSTTQFHLKRMHICAIWLWGIFGFWYCKWNYNPLCDFIGPLAIVQITQLAMACVLLLTHSSRVGVVVPVLYMCVLNRASWLRVCVWDRELQQALDLELELELELKPPQSVALGTQLGFVLGSLCWASSNDIWGTDVYVKPIIRRRNETWGCEMSDMEVEGAGLEWVGWGGWE